MKRKVFLIVIFFIIRFPLIAWGNEGVYYIAAGPGLLFYNSDIDEKTTLDYAFDGEFSCGRYLSKNMALEVALGYIHDGHRKNDIRAHTLSLAAIWLYPRGRIIHLFAGGGCGYYCSEFDGYINGVRTVDEDNRPGANILAGIEFDIGSRFFGRFQCTYRFLRNLRFDHQTLDPSGFSTITKIGFTF